MLLLLLLLLSFLVRSTFSCPLTDNYLSLCHCGILTNGDSYIECEYQSLDHVPNFKRSFAYDELILSNNRIVNLTRHTFDDIRTIKRIHLDYNRISFIDVDILRLLGNYLEELLISADDRWNSLEFLTRYPLKKLRVLKLDHFDLSQIDLSNAFINMTKLEILSLRSCQLNRLPNLPNIRILDLNNNLLSDSIVLPSSLVHVNLGNNQISSIILPDNPQIISLNLSGNILDEFLSLSSISKLKYLDLSRNELSAFDGSSLGESLTHLELSSNHLSSLDIRTLPGKLVELSLRNNSLEQFDFTQLLSAASLTTLDLSDNQLKTFTRNSASSRLIEQLIYLNLARNPLECNCHLQWLRRLIAMTNDSQTKSVKSTIVNDPDLKQIESVWFPNKKNISLPITTKLNSATTWTCGSKRRSFLSADFKCTSMMPRVLTFNVTFVNLMPNSRDGLLVQWSLDDDHHVIHHLQMSIEPPLRMSARFRSNQTRALISSPLSSNIRYHVCLILLHRYARDKYCRDVHTVNPIPITSTTFLFKPEEILFEKDKIDAETFESSTINMKDISQTNTRMMLIGSCLGGLLTFVLLFTCCYLCCKIHKYKAKHVKTTASSSTSSSSSSYQAPIQRHHTMSTPVYHKHTPYCSSHSQHFHFSPPPYPIYHPCPHYHHPIYSSENVSNSTDSSHIESSLSTANPKHIYQTIDSNDLTPSQPRSTELFDLWNESVQPKR